MLSLQYLNFRLKASMVAFGKVSVCFLTGHFISFLTFFHWVHPFKVNLECRTISFYWAIWRIGAMSFPDRTPIWDRLQNKGPTKFLRRRHIFGDDFCRLNFATRIGHGFDHSVVSHEAPSERLNGYALPRYRREI